MILDTERQRELILSLIKGATWSGELLGEGAALVVAVMHAPAMGGDPPEGRLADGPPAPLNPRPVDAFQAAINQVEAAGGGALTEPNTPPEG